MKNRISHILSGFFEPVINTYLFIILISLISTTHAAHVNMPDINAPVDTNGRIQLFIAARDGQIERVRALLKQGADINKAKLTDGTTPLYIAAQEGHFDIVQLLLKHGAHIDAARNDGSTPLFIAAQEGHCDIAQLFLKHHAQINAAMTYGTTPLYIAAQNGHFDIVCLLLDNYAQIDAAITDGSTPLFIAAQKGHFDIVQLFLDHHAQIHARNDGATPLYIAAYSGHFNITKLLLKHGAQIDAATTGGSTPLYSAAQQGHFDIVQLFLNNGAQIDAVRTNGSTPLAAALDGGDVQMAHLLLASGAQDFSFLGYTARTYTEYLLNKTADQAKRSALQTILQLLALFGLNPSPPKTIDQLMFEDVISPAIIAQSAQRHFISYLLDMGHSPHKPFALEDRSISITPCSLTEAFLARRTLTPEQRERARTILGLFAQRFAQKKEYQRLLYGTPSSEGTLVYHSWVQGWLNMPRELRAHILAYTLTPKSCSSEFRELVAQHY